MEFTINNKTYDVIIDEDDHANLWDRLNDWDCFENDQERLEYYNKFKNDELTSFIVIEKEKCKCCNQYFVKECIGSVHAIDEQEALQQIIGLYFID